MAKLIACVDAQLGVAKNGKIPWSFAEDLAFFRQQTLGGIVIMGRGTWLSIPGHFLDGRTNCVISHTLDFAENVEIFRSLEAALEKYENAWIIGGAQLYNYALQNGFVDRALITHVKKDYNADKFISKKYFDSFRKNVIFSSDKYDVIECLMVV